MGATGTKKKRSLTGYRLVFTAILLLTCIILLVGAAWARYRTEDFSFLTYEAKQPDAVSIWSGYDPQTGALTSNGSNWTIYNDGGTLRFYISNGTVDQFAEKDQKVTIRLLSSLTAREVEARLTVDGESWESISSPIASGTALERSFGPGRIYMFQDASGKEASWTLSGEEFAVLSARFDVAGLEQQESVTELFQIQVTGATIRQ